MAITSSVLKIRTEPDLGIRGGLVVIEWESGYVASHPKDAHDGILKR